jgi:hypothetical protein
MYAVRAAAVSSPLSTAAAPARPGGGPDRAESGDLYHVALFPFNDPSSVLPQQGASVRRRAWMVRAHLLYSIAESDYAFSRSSAV